MAKTFNIKALFAINDKASGVLKKIAGAAGPVEKSLRSLARQGSRVTASITKIITPLAAMTAIAGRGLFNGIKSAQQYANAVGDLADRLGVSTKFMQEQHYIAQLNAGSAEEMTAAIETLSSQYGALQAGTGKLYTGLQKISPALAKQVKNAKSTEAAFDLLVKAIRKVEDPARKMYLSQLAFGTAGKMMVNVSSQSEEALNKLKIQANELGVVIEDKAIRQSQDMGEALDTMKESVRGVFNIFASKMIPILMPFIKRISEWIKANRELIATKIDKFVEQFAELLNKIDLENVLDAMSSFASVCLRVTEFLAGLNKWVIALGFALASGLICNIFSLLRAFFNLLNLIPGLNTLIGVLKTAFLKLGFAILTTPIGWIAMGIAGIVAAFALLWNKCEGFRNFWIGLWKGIKTTLKFAWDFITGAIDGIMHPIDTLMAKFESLRKFGGWISDKLGFGNDEEEHSKNKPQAPIPNQPMQLSQVYTPYPQATAQQTQSRSEVVVKFDNLPKEANVEKVSKEGNTDLGVEYGYAMGGA